MDGKITLAELADLLGVPYGTLRYHVDAGRVPYERGARRGRGFERRFDLTAVLAALGAKK